MANRALINAVAGHRTQNALAPTTYAVAVMDGVVTAKPIVAMTLIVSLAAKAAHVTHVKPRID